MSKVVTDPDGKKRVILSTSDKDADWLKFLDGGKFKKADLAAHKEAARLHREREEGDSAS